MTEPRRRLTREEVAKIEIGRTHVSRPAAAALVALFAGSILAVPVIQAALGLAGGPQARAKYFTFWKEFQSLGEQTRRASRGLETTWQRGVRFNSVLLRSINRFQTALESQSFLTRWLLPPSQLVLSRRFGVGNERARIGRQGWLFYRPGVEYLTGPPFLDPDRLHRRSLEGNEWIPAPRPDPRRAILQFHRQLRRRGIELIVMPTPVKPSVHPEKLTARASGDRLLQNPSYDRLVAELRAEGVGVFQPGPPLIRRKRRTGRTQYLKTDTHWRPDAMEYVAGRLAARIRRDVDLSASRSVDYTRKEQSIENHGDLTVMLKLPDGQRAFPPETVTIHPVHERDMPWQPDKSADVLLLGDSFSNVYSLAEMNWGAAAGLPQQLSCDLGRPVDCIVINDDGAYATRERLSRLLARGRDRLAGKKVVLWQFAQRELAVGDWKLLPMTLGEPTEEPFLSLEPGREVIATGRVDAITRVPRTGQIYQLLVGLHLADLESPDGELAADEAIVYTWGVRKEKRTAAADLTYGEHVRMRLRAMPEKYEAMKRLPFGRDRLDFALDTCWGELLEDQ